jgi:hypothetical protein
LDLMKKSIIISVALGVAIVSGLIFFQISNICYPKRVEIEYDLKDLESGSMDYASCLNLQNKIEIFNQKCDPDFNEIRC